MRNLYIMIAFFLGPIVAEAGSCKVTLPRCQSSNYAMTFYDAQGNADTVENQCMGLANVYHKWCGLTKKEYALTEYFNNSNANVAQANVRSTTRCQIKYTSCPQSPGWNNFSFNEYWVNNTDLSRGACVKRAQDYYNWCGDADNVVKAEFYDYYTRVGKPAIASCNTSNTTNIETYQYKRIAGVDRNLLSLDVHKPFLPCKGTRKLLVYIHGGGWVSGDKTGVTTGNPDMVRYFTERGFTFVSINYRLFIEGNPSVVSIANQAQDAASAIAWLHKNKTKFDIDSAQTFLYGHSAGAHLVSLVGTDKKYLNAVGVDLASIQGVISSDVHAYDVPEALKLMKDDPVLVGNMAALQEKFGYTYGKQISLSPMNFLNNDNIPDFLIISAGIFKAGLAPSEVSNQMSDMFKTELVNNWAYANHFHFPELSHSDLVDSKNMGNDGGKITEQVDSFLAKRFGITK